jgi:hypothetical protein
MPNLLATSRPVWLAKSKDKGKHNQGTCAIEDIAKSPR